MDLHYPQQADFSWISQGWHLRSPSLEELSWLDSYRLQTDANQSSALLLLHGYASTPGVFRYFFPHLKGYDEVYAPTLAGHGQNIAKFSQASAQDWLDQVQSILKELCQNYQRVDVLGLSMGGLLAAYHIHDFPIHHLYLLAPAFHLVKSLDLLLATAKTADRLGFSSIANLGGKIANPKEAELSYRQLPIHSIIEVLKLIQNYQYQPWTTPTTLFLGQGDKVVHSTKVAALLKNLPHLDLKMLERSNHVLPIDYEYQTILKTLINK